MLLRGGDPYAIVRRRVAPVPKNEHYLVSQIDSKAAEHGAGFGWEAGEGIQHKLIRNGLALLSPEKSCRPAAERLYWDEVFASHPF